VHAGFWWGNLKKRDTFKGLGVDGRIILKLVFKKQGRILAWINLIQGREKWRAVMNRVMKVGFHKMR
jgi:hypothetical protein